MEFLLSLFNQHGPIIVTALVIGIAVVIIMLLLFAQKKPEEVVKEGIGGSENVEGALRRVLGEQRWLQAGAGDGEVDPQKVGALEQEVLEKDRTIAELNKKLTQGGGEGAATGGDDPDLMNRINELEARLQEYEIIEDDIADLSLYKTENEKLRAELNRLKGVAAGEGMPEPADAGGGVEILNEEEPAPENQEVTPEPEPETPENTIQVDTSGGPSPDAADLVAEFEKVVNNQEQISTDTPAPSVSVEEEGETGKVVMAEELGPEKVTEPPEEIHPKLKNVNPDSKEEAEVFISELKSLKNSEKKEEPS